MNTVALIDSMATAITITKMDCEYCSEDRGFSVGVAWGEVEEVGDWLRVGVSELLPFTNKNQRIPHFLQFAP